MRRSHLAIPAALIAALAVAVTLCAQTAVTLTPTATPAAGQAGVTSITLTGSGFPAATALPANTSVKLEPAAGGTAVSTNPTTVATVVGTTRRVTFLVPSSINVTSPTAYLASVAGTASDGTAFASTNKASLTINPPPAITGISPALGQAGQRLLVAISGQFTNYLLGSTRARFGAGVSVGGAPSGGFGPVNVTGPTTANAQLIIDINATSGPRDVTVATGVQQAALPNGFTVTPATLQSIAVTPANPSITKGATQQFTATGTYSDSSTQNLTASVTWASATLATATIAAGGLASGVGVGTSTISATLGAVSGSTLLTVTAPATGSVTYTYDSQGRLASATYTSPTGSVTVTYSYDAAGNRTAVVAK